MRKSQVKVPENQLSLDYSPQEKSSFLSELSSYILTQHKDNLGDVNIIFPNRRAGLYFLRELANNVESATWAPNIFTLEEFYGKYSSLVVADRYALIFNLYSVYSEVYKSSETIDNFFFWGEMLLRDFDEIDKFLIDAEPLFSTLTQFKGLENLDYLDDEQKEIIKKFWMTVEKSKSPESWISFWSKLATVYKNFRSKLLEIGVGYSGMILRDALNEVKDQSIKGKVLFAGFNALTKGEEAFISHFTQNYDAEILWDIDEYYMKPPHEAGRFLRNYKKNPVLNQSFAKVSSEHIKSQKNIKVIGSGTWIGQVKMAGQLLEELSMLSGFEEESTVIVLPDEKLLLPVLNAIPQNITDINVTMGIMLRYTSAYSLLENLILLHKNSKIEDGTTQFFYKNILTVLRHPVTQSLHDSRYIPFESHIRKSKKLYYSKEELSEIGVKSDVFFSESGGNLTEVLANAAHYLFENTTDRLQKIFLNALYHHLTRLSDTISEYRININHDSLIRLFRQIASTGRIPFSGEPVKGLQIMGLFETRNLDFDNVFVLSLNEGILPRGLISQSFIPYALRRGFELPTFEDSHSIQSYLFYRILQRSKRVHLFYNSIGEVIGGETSRYIQQLKYGFPGDVEFVQLKENYNPDEEKEISVNHSPHIIDSLQRYISGDSYLSPTALASYLDCSLKFYFKYILRLRRENEVDEDINPLEYGNLLHNSAEYLYEDFVGRALDDLTEDDIDNAINKAFSDTVFDPEVGPARIRAEALRKTLIRLNDVDSRLTPLEIVSLEGEYIQKVHLDEADMDISIGGKIDRVDKLKDGTVRLIDYKTGNDRSSYKNMDTLFEGENKAAFQLMVYSLLYSKSDLYNGENLQPGLYSMRSIFKRDFSPVLSEGSGRAKSRIYSVNERLNEFEERLKGVLADIFVKQEFKQVEDISACKFCDFLSICRREKAFKANG